MKRVLGVVLGFFVASASVLAQTAAKPLKFEVVSIKRNVGQPRMIMFGAQPGVVTADGFRCMDWPLSFLFQIAYAPGQGNGFLDMRRIEGAPDWLNNFNERYDVIAKVADEDLLRWRDVTQRRAMMQEMVRALLADRMKVSAHVDSREMPVYELMVDKGGPKFQTAETVDAGELKQKHSYGMEAPGGAVVMPGPRGELQLYGVSMPVLAEGLLSFFAGRPVLDKTGLEGEYDVRLTPPPPTPPPPPSGMTAAPAMDPGPSLFTVLQEQLGLKLVPAKGPVETLVIDHVERPSEN